MIAKTRQERSTESIIEQSVGLVRWLQNFDYGDDKRNVDADSENDKDDVSWSGVQSTRAVLHLAPMADSAVR